MQKKTRYNGLISLTVLALLAASAVVSYGRSLNYAYDELNRLKQVEHGDGSTTEYHYDGAGNRLQTLFTGLYAISVTKGGAGTGVVRGTGFDCGSDCSESASSGSVALTAISDTGSSFTGWSGCDSISGSQCTMNYDSNKTVTATFSLSSRLTVARSGAQQGTVTSSPAGIACGTACSGYYPIDTKITLTSALPPGHCVTWTGCTQNYASCSLTMGTSNTSVTATYQTDKRLYVTRTGSPRKRITSSPPGIDCGSDCNEAYPQGTKVTLTSEAPPKGKHVEWSGCAVQDNPLQCVYTMDCTDHTVTANFAKKYHNNDRRHSVRGTTQYEGHS